MTFPILSILILLPLVAAALILLRGDAQTARVLALLTTLVEFVLGIGLWLTFDSDATGFQFVEKLDLFAPFLSWHLGIDGIALVLIMLSVFLMPIVTIASWSSIQKRVPEYFAAFLLMESLMIGVFASLDLFLFYLFFEGGLIPMYLIIGIWGGSRRIYASYKFFLYTLLGSVLMLIAMLYMAGTAHTTDIPTLLTYDFAPGIQTWLWLAFFASFAVKVPMWPFHTWLPDAHPEAPTAGSAILAGVLLKLGGYGFVRFSLPMFPDASVEFMWLIFGLSMVAVVYTSLVALAQTDIKRLIAYSSIAHMGFVTVGLFAFNRQGIEGGIIMMLSHGLISAALFLAVGMLYDRLHTHTIDRFSGLANNMPKYALFFMFFTMASVGLPATSGFVAEFLVLLGAYAIDTWVALVMTTGIILGAAYMLWLYRRIIFGTSDNADAAAMPDMSAREIAVLLPLVLGVLWMGIYPQAFLQPLHTPVTALLERLDRVNPGIQSVHTPTAKPAAQPAAPPQATPAEGAK
jgi:NADH-quinone oxidoreductase subunit M